MGVRDLFTRSIRPDYVPNDNEPPPPPGTVGPPSAAPGDAHGVLVDASGEPGTPGPPLSPPMPWSGWPADWFTPNWNGGQWGSVTDTAWVCLDLNASILSTMPPYLVDAAPSLSTEWLRNPNPEIYTSWGEFAKQLFWDYQMGEAFVIATARYATGLPARFHVVPPWLVQIDYGPDGTRRYIIGSLDVTEDLLHIRYRSTVHNLHGEGPLDAVQPRVVAAATLMRYATTLAAGGGIPSSVLTHPEELNATQAAKLQAQWVQARMSKLGEPAVVSGGVTWQAAQINPRDMALIELSEANEARIAIALAVPPFLVGLPSAGHDAMTYKNVNGIFDYHWRAGLRPKASAVMGALSQWALPRGSRVELNRDAYVEPAPLERAQTAQILNSIRDDNGNPVMTVQQIQNAERLTNTSPDDLSAGVLR
jgi:HK97 family phage portal protein